MGRIDADTLVRTLIGIAVLMATTLGVLVAVRAPHPAEPLVAILRGLVQLAALSLVLNGVITHPLWVGIALTVMFGVAASVSARRLGGLRANLPVTALAMGAGVAIVLVVVFVTGALAPSPQYLLAIGGIVIGNAMSIATIGGRRFAEAAHDRWDEVEAWLSLGATPRRSTLDVARQAIRSALIPTVDQTKTTGLVTLPGAFVGAIFGGASPLDAGRFQIVVLAGIMAAGAVTAAILVVIRAPVRVRPTPPG